jgi:hypothetical protein
VIVKEETIGTLDSGDCTTVSVRTIQGLERVGTGTYRGVVMLSANQVKPVARQVVVTVEEPEKSVSAAGKPIRVTMRWPSNITRIDRPRYAPWPILINSLTLYAPSTFLLKTPTYAPWPWWPPEKQVELPLRSKGGAALDVKKGDTLGTLSGGFGDGYAKVIAAEKLDGVESGRVRRLTVRIHGLEGVGTYTETLTIGGVDIDVELFVSDALPWAFFFCCWGRPSLEQHCSLPRDGCPTSDSKSAATHY